MHLHFLYLCTPSEDSYVVHVNVTDFLTNLCAVITAVNPLEKASITLNKNLMHKNNNLTIRCLQRELPLFVNICLITVYSDRSNENKISYWYFL
jgi:hypothetical protein